MTLDYSYYDILGLVASASNDEIRQAYRERARYYHPDVTDLDPEIAASKLKIINEAYETLRDQDRRRAYDVDLFAQREVALWGHFPQVLEYLVGSQCKQAFDYLKPLKEQAPGSDMVRGLLATTFHLQARLAFEATKFQTARKFLLQALSIPFDDWDLRIHLQTDLALVDQRLRDGAEIGSAAAIARQLEAEDPALLLRALGQAEALEVGPDSASLVPRLWKVAESSPFREARLGALRGLLVHNPEAEPIIKPVLDLYLLNKAAPGPAQPKAGERAALLRRIASPAAAPAAPLLAPLVWDGSEDARRQVVDALADMSNPAVVACMLPLLFSNSLKISAGAATALLRIEGRFNVADQLKGLVGLESDQLRVTKLIEDYTRRLGKAKMAQAEGICSFWETPAKRPEVIRTWMRRSFEPLLGFLLVAMLEKRGQVQEAVRQGLAAVGLRAVAPLLSALRDDDWLVRKLAAETLGDIKSTSSTEDLICALEDTKPLVAKAAAQALGEMLDPRAVHPLLNALKNPDQGVADAAQIALNRIRGQRSRI